MRLCLPLGLVLLFVSSLAVAQSALAQPYEIGSPVLRDLWVDPAGGNDANSGASRATALRTLDAAWRMIPQGTTLTGTGYRIQLLSGVHPRASVPNYFESRHGTASCPIIIQSADGTRTAHVEGDLNLFDVRYLYLIGLDLVPNPPTDVVHCDSCDHFLIRDCHLRGGTEVQETLKVNQSQYVYVESSDIHGAWDNAIDFVAVQYGHVLANRIHDAGDWCEYAKGGSAHLRIEGNELYDCGTGGFTAGQGTGFQFMSPPWIHYEAYDIKVVNNVIHDTDGAGLGVNGGYDILLAHNTLVRVGSRSHMLEVVFGLRSCDGQPGDADRGRCQSYLNLGGWGTTEVSNGENDVYIPNRNVFIYNNVFYNPPGFLSSQLFSVGNPRSNEAGANAPSTAVADTNLRIRGNLFFDGDSNTPLGLGENDDCSPSNPTCSPTQLRADNTINAFEPRLGSDYRPVAGGNVLTARTFAIPDFGWSDAPAPPAVPPGTLSNTVPRDRDGNLRGTTPVAGAYAGTTVLPPAPISKRRSVRP
jgi:hypothetical protein